ncbi:hypothetical protein Ahy_B06g081969 isoform A [Arachis hypogaea]|uniref:Uncharacterized protein n=1 Tax=Arachis hypogaea TaxID=3818 RepID=A0A444YMI6_ARAHY|nr:hypothetical protein Ahy_B06g081969 isoform A [Arachis hypogaea]
MDKALKEHAYDTIKRTFLYEEDDHGKRKKVMIQRLGKIWKEARNHLYHKCYDEQKSWEENLKKKPSGINVQQWRWFINYRLKESTKTKCSKSVEATLYTYWGSKTTARLRDEEEAIANIESQDGSSKEISLTDSLAQVLGKEHLGRVRGLGFGPCATEIICNMTQQSNSGVRIGEYKREITELKGATA